MQGTAGEPKSLLVQLLVVMWVVLETEAAGGKHEVLTFDFGWRFYLGVPGEGPPGPPPPPPAPPPVPAECAGDLAKVFPVDASGVEYKGLQTPNKPHLNATECAAACCDLTEKYCWTWQYDLNPGGHGCWIGFGANPTKPKPGQGNWTGGSRAGTPPHPPPRPAPAPSPGDGPSILPNSSVAAAPSFDDSKWELVDLPHDYIVSGTYDKNTIGDQGPGSKAGGAGQSYLPRYQGFYRKHFHLPTEWKGTVVSILFEGVFRATKIWLNGEAVREHAGFAGDAHGEGGGVGMGGGYTSFTVRLDNASSVNFGAKENVLSVYVDPREGSGWFYEGGGIYRRTWLHSQPPVHIEADSVFAHGHVAADAIQTRGAPALGAAAKSAAVIASATVVNTGGAAAEPAVSFALFDAEGKAVGSPVTKTVPVPAAAATSKPATAASGDVSVAVPNPELWSVARPYVYTLRVTTDSGDSYNTSVGIYSTRWTGDKGFFLNEEHVKIRGFCNHESFGGVGMAIPDRVNLYRAQALRSVGGNGWRMSHNPVTPGLLDILDRVGVVAMDETRELHSDPISVMNYGAMVKRDRNHPSVVIWSFCNEGGCGEDGAQNFSAVSKAYDPTRPTLGNRAGSGTSGMDAFTDVEGFSHKAAEVFDEFNAKEPNRPKFASECCSCSSTRTPQQVDDLSSTVGVSEGGNLSKVNGLSCTAEQSNRSNSRPFISGTMVWTLFDYYGESHGWPRVSSAYGQFDLAGFQKNTARWYRTWWLSAVPTSDASRPVGFGPSHMCFPYIDRRKEISVETEAATVELYEDGKKAGTATVAPLQTATLKATSGVKNYTTVCRSADGSVTASGTLMKAGNATKIMLSLDAPSAKTGTGTALVLDGHDAAMLRATVVDSAGVTVGSSAANISFVVTAGPGRVLATHNGDNACHEPNHASWHSAFAGLARCIVQVTEHRTGTAAERARLASIDVDTAHSAAGKGAPASSITVTASSPGLASATVEIPVSADSEQHGVLPTAARSMAAEQRWE